MRGGDKGKRKSERGMRDIPAFGLGDPQPNHYEGY